MAIRLSYQAADYAAGDGSHNGLLALIGASSVINFYTGSVGANSNTTPAGTAMGSLTVTSVAYTTGSAGTAPILTATMGANGTVPAGGNGTNQATCFQWVTSGATPIMDGMVAVSGGDINFAAGITWLSGGTLSISSLVVTMPVT